MKPVKPGPNPGSLLGRSPVYCGLDEFSLRLTASVWYDRAVGRSGPGWI
jgi:hypothetical protein